MDKKTERLLLQDITSTLDEHLGLMVTFKNEIPSKIHGTYRLCDDTQVLLGQWEIMIPVPAKYPYEFPLLFETSGLIPSLPERHMNSRRVACTELDIRAEARAKKGITLSQFLAEYVDRYFSWQVLYDAGFAGELLSWGHRNDGPREYFYEALGTKSHRLIYQALTLLHDRETPGRNDPCFCQSGRKYKVCHERGMKEVLCTVGVLAIKQKRDELFEV